MLKEERQSIILEIINVRNKIRSSELSEHLQVSEDTIRRDLRELAEGGFIKKVHGGALANPQTPEAIHRQGKEPGPEMKRIAEKASALLSGQQVVILDGGLICEQLVMHMEDGAELTVFTNAIGVADRLADWPAVTTYLLGGKMAGRERITCGMETVDALADIRADLTFLQLSSLHHDIGMTSKQREVALTRQKMLASARQTVGLCLSEHLGRVQPYRIGSVSRLDYLITELEPSAEEFVHFRTKGITIL